MLLVAALFAQQVQWEVVIMEEQLDPERFIYFFICIFSSNAVSVAKT